MCLMFEKRERDTEKHLKLVMLRFRNNFTLVATVAKTQHSISRYHGNCKKMFPNQKKMISTERFW